MKLGILGTGQIVQDLLPVIGEIGFESISILGTERSRTLTEALAAKYGLARCYFDYDEMLSSDADTIYVALPNFLHYSFGRKALEAGKNVILEKPAATNLAEFQELRRLAEGRKLILLEAMNIHYLPAFIGLKKDMGAIGQVRVVSMNYSQYSSRYDAFLDGETLPAFDPKKAGGALMDINAYNLHFAVGLFGKPNSIRYYATVQRGIDTSGIMALDYGDFKAVCIGAKDCQAPTRSTIQGEKGCIVIPAPVNQMTSYTVTENKDDSQTREFQKEHRLLCEFREFRRIIEERDTRKVTEMLDIGETVAAIMQEGRKQEGIVFGNDR